MRFPLDRPSAQGYRASPERADGTGKGDGVKKLGLMVMAIGGTWLALVPGSAWAAPGEESARGTVHKTERLGEFGCFFPDDPTEHCFSSVTNFTAHDDGTGADGHMNYRARDEFRHFGSILVTGEVDCLAVTGNVAVISGDVERVQVEGSQPGWTRFMIVAEDGGEPSGGNGDRAQLHFSQFATTDPITCVTQPEGTVIGVEERANVEVRDDVASLP